jgi:hypothetical protein
VSVSQAQQAWDGCVAAATQIKAELQEAITACVASIRDASGLRFARNPHGVGSLVAGVKGFVKDHAGALAKLSGVLKGLATDAFSILHGVTALVVNGLASFGNAMLQNPGALVTTLGGTALFAVSAGGEGLGVALDATGIGAVFGAPLNVVSALGMTAGAGITASGVLRLAADAAGADRVTVMRTTESRPVDGQPDRGLGMDPATGQFRQSEYETAQRIQAEKDVKLERSSDPSVDWVDNDGHTYDAVGGFKSRYFDQQWSNLQVRILDHMSKADFVPVDVRVSPRVRPSKCLNLSVLSVLEYLW